MTTSRINQICPIPASTQAILVRISPVASEAALDSLAVQLNDILSYFDQKLPVYPVVGNVFFEPLTLKNIASVLPMIGQRQYDVYVWSYNPDGIGMRGGANDYLTTVYGVYDLIQVIHKLVDDHTVIQIVERDGLNKRRAPATIVGFDQAKAYIATLSPDKPAAPEPEKTLPQNVIDAIDQHNIEGAD